MKLYLDKVFESTTVAKMSGKYYARNIFALQGQKIRVLILRYILFRLYLGIRP
jgi:hypothetical protein